MSKSAESKNVQVVDGLPLSEGGMKRKNIPAGLWTKCPECNHVIFNKSLKENDFVCPNCQRHFIMGVDDRIEQLLDEGSFKEMAADLTSADPISFKGPKTYSEKRKEDEKKTGLKSACKIGEGTICGKKVAFAATDSRFIMGSMGSVLGEKITRIIEHGIKKKLPVVIVSGSGGGARMYEGLFSLMQMAKTSAALSRLKEKNIPFISVLTNPTMGGVMASFSSLGDVIIAEPKALLGFAGPRVIEQTIKQKLPDDFQSSEFLHEHGMVDMVVHRQELAEKIKDILSFLTK